MYILSMTVPSCETSPSASLTHWPKWSSYSPGGRGGLMGRSYVNVRPSSMLWSFHIFGQNWIPIVQGTV
uniref:Uncharacterized protein n=1 Tax=Chelonoidis abingdonii TaxID=106734 RepID=A0A8C0H418_CHEAB